MTPEYEDSKEKVREALRIYKDMVSEVEKLEKLFSGRSFTLDGHLIGSIGEAAAVYYYGITLVETNKKAIDGVYQDKTVQIKTVQQDSVSLDFSNIKEPDYLLVLYLNKSGNVYEVYNGPWDIIQKEALKANSHGYTHFRVNRLLEISKSVDPKKRIPNNNEIICLEKQFKNPKKRKGDINERIQKFTSKYIELYSSSDTNEDDIMNSFPEDCEKLGFIMDCGKMFEAMYGHKAFSDVEELKGIIDEIDEVMVLGSGIFSYWRYVTHWSYNEHLLDEKNKEWMLLALKRLSLLTEMVFIEGSIKNPVEVLNEDDLKKK